MLHQVDELSKEKFKEINALLKNPLNKSWKQNFNWFLYTLGKRIFKQVKYRHIKKIDFASLFINHSPINLF